MLDSKELNILAQNLDDIINGNTKDKKYGFLFLQFPFYDADGVCSYTSNADRSDMIEVLKKLVESLESNEVPRYEH